MKCKCFMESSQKVVCVDVSFTFSTFFSKYKQLFSRLVLDQPSHFLMIIRIYKILVIDEEFFPFLQLL